MVNIEGRNPVIEALKGNRTVHKVLIQKGLKGFKINDIKNECSKQNIQLNYVSKIKLDNMSFAHIHQGVIAIAEELKMATVDEILAVADERNEKPFIIILDQIQDPHNFGSIIRTAYSAGAHGIIYQEKRSVGITPIVIKTSAGAVEHILLSQVTNINSTLDLLKKAGLWIFGADMEGDKSYYQVDFNEKIGLVFGSEGSGLRKLVKNNCDFLIKIPMKGEMDSLNASIAMAIIGFEVVKQRS